MNEMNEKKIHVTDLPSEEDKLFSEELLDTEIPEDDTPEAEEEDPATAPLLPDGTFRQRTKAFWHRLKTEQKYLGLCFLFPALLIFLVYAMRGVFPFGENSVLVLDLNGQYVYFFAALRDAVLDGGSLVYSFARNLGGEFMGIYAYYLASPFSWLVVLFPATHITEALLLMLVLKTGCCGLTFGIYLESTRKRNRPATVAFAIMYALCTFAVVMQHNTMWIDNMILLPLIALGVENVIKHRKYKLFILSLAMAILSNFYIGYMTCLFVALYFFYYYFAHGESFRNPTGEAKHFQKSLVRMACVGLIAVCIGMVIILPAYTSLQFGKSTFSTTVWNFSQNFDFMDLVTKVFFGSYDTVRPEGLPFLFSGTLMILLAPLYFFAPRIRTREKAASALFITAFVLSFNTGALDIIWHGFQRPNWLNHRYSFMLCFFLLILAYKAYEQIREIRFRSIAAVSAVVIALLFVIQKLDYENVQDLPTVWASLAFILLYIFILRAVTYRTDYVRRSASLILVLAVMMEMGFSAAQDLYRLDCDVIFSSRTGYVDFINRLQPAVDSIEAYDSSFYRFEKTVHRKTNDNMSLGIKGLSNSTSTLNAAAIEFLHDMGMCSKSHWSQYRGATPLLDAITGIKYIIADPKETITPLYKPLWTVEAAMEENNLVVYENPYALSIAFGISNLILEEDEIVETLYNEDGSVKEEVTLFDSYLSPFERSNVLVRAMIGNPAASALYTPVNVVGTTNANLTLLNVVEHRGFRVTDDTKDGAITYQLSIDSANPVCLYIPSGYPRECKVYVENRFVGYIGGNNSNHVLNLGSFTPGETISVRIVLNDTNLYIKNGSTLFYYFNDKAFTSAVDILKGGELAITEYSDTYFAGTISVAEGKELIFTSIPYDSGWKVTCDGEKVETICVLGTFLAYYLPAGDHQLTMKYSPSCLTIGGTISLFGVAAFVCLSTGEWFLKKKKKAVPAASEETAEGPDPDLPEEDGRAEETKNSIPEDTDE